MTRWLVLLALLGVPSLAQGADYYVAPTGIATNPGTLAAPISLTKALSSTSPAKPGDTIWLRGGTYQGTWVSVLTGTAEAPIVVRQFPGERATLDMAPSAGDALLVYGAYTWYWGFELISSDPVRSSKEVGSWPYDIKRGYGVNARGRHLKFINLIAHDLANGFGIWAEGFNIEVYGSLAYYNGWQAPDRAHGHGIYTQNKAGRHVLSDNITFHQFSHGIHAYGSDAAFLDYITLDGNISFGNGSIGSSGITRELLLGGGDVAADPIVTDNSTYGAQVNFGYGAGCTNAVISGNYFVGTGALLIHCAGSFSSNTIHSIYNHGSLPSLYPANTYLPASPTIPAVVRVRPNRYEAGRAHIAIYNWLNAPTVSVELVSAGLTIGQAFEIRDAQNYFGSPVYAGVYSGAPVSLPMMGLTAAAPIGLVPVPPRHTAPRFAAFVVVPTAAGLPAPPPPPPPVVILPPAPVEPEPEPDEPPKPPVVPPPTPVVPLPPLPTPPVQANRLPIVYLISPAGPTTYRLGPIRLEAIATDHDGRIASVLFAVNGVPIAADLTAPHLVVWTPLAPGAYSLTATAVDNRGATTLSRTVQVLVR